MNVPALIRPCLLFLVVLSMQFVLPDAHGQLRIPGQLRAPDVIRNAITRQLPATQSGGSWYPYVVARREDRDWIRNTPIDCRPNRPLHIWGNTRRRILR